jgi:mannose-6-phosphate isomerase-like protein (cupin superfamily)
VELGPVGQPQALSTIDGFVTKAFQEGPRQEVLLSCSTNTRTTLVQMGPTQPERLYESAEATYFVLSGEGIVHMDGKDTSLKLDGFVSVPRGVSHSLTRTGRKPLIFIMQLSGEPCEQAK